MAPIPRINQDAYLRVELADSRARLAAKLCDQAGILHCDGLVEGGADGNTILVEPYAASEQGIAIQTNTKDELLAWFTITTPITPLCPCIRFSVSSTSVVCPAIFPLWRGYKQAASCG